MSIAQLCKDITLQGGETLKAGPQRVGAQQAGTQETDAPSHERSSERLVCPEYSKTAQEVKTYPNLERDRLFSLCWHLDGKGRIHAAMSPSPTPSCCHVAFLHGGKTQLHTHDYLELAYVAKGAFCQRILGRDIVFQEGDLCLIDKNCLHQDYLLDRETDILFLGIANDMFDEVMDGNVTTQRIISFLQSALLEQKDLQQYLHFKPGPDATQEMESCLASLMAELSVLDAGSRYICKGLLIRIFRLLSTRYEFSLSREQKKNMGWVVFEEITRYIRDHSATVSVRDLVDEFHFQEDYYNRLIKGRTGMTYSAYVQHIRLTKAEALLKTSSMSITDIADEVGYHNKGYFYRIFQKRYGMTPKRLRQSGGA